MKKRYGEAAVLKAIETIASWSFIPENLMDTLEKQCQKTISVDKTSSAKEKISDILNG